MFDVLLKNARVVDGSGNPWFWGEVGVKDGRIAAISRTLPQESEQTIDVGGHVVCPGFIDMHSHSDLMLFVEPEAQQKVRQGVTTEVLCQDGLSVAPVDDETSAYFRRRVSGLLGEPDVEWRWRSFGEYLDALAAARPATNVAALAPFGNIRAQVVGLEDRAPTSAELEAMRDLARRCMDEGAVGMSAGLIYPPNIYASEDELVQVLKAVNERDGFFVVHMRNESHAVMAALDEAVRITRTAMLPLHISHFKGSGYRQYGIVERMLEVVDGWRAKRHDITFDQYPYFAGATMLDAIIPPWAHVGGVEQLLARLRDPETRRRIVATIEESEPSYHNTIYNVGLEGVVVSFAKSEKNKRFEGKNLREIGEETGKPPVEAALDLILEEKTAVSMINFWGREEDVITVLKHPAQTVCTDGVIGGKPHPRLYGTYPRILGYFVREKGVLRLEEAVRKMTGAPAQRLGLRDRGLLREGFWADLVVFDPNTVADRATYENPHQYPVGIEHVLINGVAVVRDGAPTGNRPGAVLRRGRTA